MKARTKDVLPQRKIFWKLISSRHTIELKLKHFRMIKYGSANMFWTPCVIHVASNMISKKFNINKVASEIKQLSEDEREILYNVLHK